MTYKQLLTRLDKYAWWQIRRVVRGGVKMYLVTIGYPNTEATEAHKERLARIARKMKRLKKKKKKKFKYDYVPPPPQYIYFVGLSVSLQKAIRFARKKKHPHTFEMESIKLPDTAVRQKPKKYGEDDE